MKPAHIIVLILLAIGCKEDEIIVAPPSKVVVGSVNVTSMPFRDLHGLPWDPNDGPDVFIKVYDKNSNILSQTRGNPVGNATASMMPLRLGVNAALAIDLDSCYLSLWDRDDDGGSGRPDRFNGRVDFYLQVETGRFSREHRDEERKRRNAHRGIPALPMSHISHSHEMIKAVVFDFGNVICRFDNKIILRRIVDDTGRSMEELGEAVYQASELTGSYERCTVSSDEFFARIAAMCGLRMSQAEFIRTYTDKFTPIPETFELIRSLKRKYKLGLLSNTSAWDFEHGIRTAEVFPLFDAVTVSFQVHALKPEKEIYLDVLAKLEVKPCECVYIDDIEKYVEAARGLGMNAVQYRSPLELVRSLKDLDIL